MRKVLVVDDNVTIREMLKIYFGLDKWDVVEACDGVEALERIRGDRPSLVVADLQMPRLDGLALLEALRADAELSAIPVLLLTSQADEARLAKCRDAGAREVLKKPIQPREMIAAARRWASRSEGVGT